MRLLKRMYCGIFGHRPYIEFDDTEFTKIYQIVEDHDIVIDKVRFRFIAIPCNAESHVCSICDNIYWQIGEKKGHVCNITAITGLAQLCQLRKRVDWERRQRRTNYVADKLYKQYLMALKLGR